MDAEPHAVSRPKAAFGWKPRPRFFQFKSSFTAPCCVDGDGQAANMAACMERGFPRLAVQPERAEALSIVGYGPTLLDTWRGIPRPILTVSGAHDFLIGRGIVPDFHLETDPRPHKVAMLHPHPAVEYLMASVCDPGMWEKLRGHRVLMWHILNGQNTIDWIERHDPGPQRLIGGGSTAGLSAHHVAGVLGWRRFVTFGMDSCFIDGARHAGPHAGTKPQGLRYAWAGGKWWLTTRMMIVAVEEFLCLLESYDNITVDPRGDGLLQAKVREHRKGGDWVFKPEHIKRAFDMPGAGMRARATVIA